MAEAVDTLEAVLADLLAYAQRQVFTALPGRVESYDTAAQTASISILVKDVLPVRSFPVLPLVPVQFPRATASGFFISFPIEPGTTGLVVFTTLGIDRWRATGQLSEPSDARRNSITSAVFLPGLHAAADALTGDAIDASALVLGRAGGTADYVAKAALTESRIDDLTTAVIAALNASGASGPGFAGAAAILAAFYGSFGAPPTGPLPPQPSVAADDVKVT